MIGGPSNGDTYLSKSVVLALLPIELEPLRDHFADVLIPATGCSLQCAAYLRARAERLVLEGVLTRETLAACDLKSWRP